MELAYKLTTWIEELQDDVEGIVYLEIRFAPQLHKKKGLDEEKIVKAVLKGMERGMKNNPSIKVSLILCAMVLGKASLNHEDNMKTIRVAKKFLQLFLYNMKILKD